MIRPTFGALIGLSILACGSETTTASPVAPAATTPASDAVDPTVATLSVYGPSEGGTELWLDGALRGPLVDGMRLELPPGDYRFEARRDGEVVAWSRIHATAGAVSPVMVMFNDPPPAEPEPERPRAPGHVELPTALREAGDGSFDAAIVLRMLASHERALDDCYEVARGVSPDVGGTLSVGMIVLESGHVGPTEIHSGTIGEEGDRCIIGALQALRFNPGPLDGFVLYEYELRFVPDA